MTNRDILVEKTNEDEKQYDFAWKREQDEEDWREFNGNSAYEELKMGKWTDINPHLLHHGENLSVYEEQQTKYRPCKD